MPHWYSEHQGRRSRGSEPQQSRSPSVSIPAPASARDDDSGRQHTVISKGEKMTKTATPALVISTKAERSGEISLPDVTQNIGAGDLGALSHNRAEVPLSQYRSLPPLEMTIAAGGIQSFQRGTQIEKTLHRIRHFDRSGAEWRNLIPQMTGTSPHPSSFRPKRSGVEKSHSLMLHRTLGQEISRL